MHNGHVEFSSNAGGSTSTLPGCWKHRQQQKKIFTSSMLEVSIVDIDPPALLEDSSRAPHKSIIIALL
jgi:hypothetical protein